MKFAVEVLCLEEGSNFVDCSAIYQQ
jgi:hypothetical protein